MRKIGNELYVVIRKNYDTDSYDGKEGVEEILGFTRTKEEAKILLNKVFTISSFNEEKDDVEYLYRKITKEDVHTIEEDRYLNIYGYISYDLLNDNNDEEEDIFLKADKWANVKCEDEIESKFFSSMDVEKFEEEKSLLLMIYFQLDMIEFKESRSKYTTGDIRDEAINKIRKIAKEWMKKNKDKIKDIKEDKIEF